MPLFYLHVYDSAGFATDEEGTDCSGLDGARDAAIRGIRSLLAEEVLQGKFDLRGRIDIADEGGNIVTVIPFRDAVALRLDEEGA
jgi:hypothetical protein